MERQFEIRKNDLKQSMQCRIADKVKEQMEQALASILTQEGTVVALSFRACVSCDICFRRECGDRNFTS